MKNDQICVVLFPKRTDDVDRDRPSGLTEGSEERLVHAIEAAGFEVRKQDGVMYDGVTS